MLNGTVNTESIGVVFMTQYPTSDTISHALCAHIHFTQVYNETIRDLLVPSGPLDLREDTQKGLVVNKLTRYQVSQDDAYH